MSAALTSLHATADLVMILARPDVVVQGLGAGTARATVRANGRQLLVWLRLVPLGTGAVCASYRAPDGHGRFVVHHSLTVSAAGTVAVEPEPDDGC